MQVKVQLNNLRTTPRKSRQVIDLIRNKSVAQARALLEFTVKRSSEPVLKLLNSAVATAVNDLKLEESNLTIFAVTVDEGPKLKRSFPMSRGRAYPILKRTSHITLILSEIKPTDAPKPVKAEAKKETKPAAEKPVKAAKAPKVSKAKKANTKK
ncbi:50S ribosomal protein L22 [Candidatus Parcubacteria bacterium]|nr:50S ribosomal protein L22 [Candidatus Parcubacteria bacterium]